VSRYAFPIFLGAFLLFQVQPIIARCILPWFGGSPSVWTTCMLFFQVLLLVGYAYSHLIIDRLRPRGQAIVHTLLIGLSLAALAAMSVAWGRPILPPEGWKPDSISRPVLRIIGILSTTVGLPYLVLATTSPLLQAWFSLGRPKVSPYRLYTVSNIGSVLALLSYPFLVEPLLALRAQSWVWGAGYALFSLGAIGCVLDAWRLRAKGAGDAARGQKPADSSPPGRRRKLLWVGLPALACVLFLAMTNDLCSEVAVIPFLWILPLTIYLLSFIICFYSERWYQRRFYTLALIVAVAATLLIIPRTVSMNARLQIAIYSVTLFICCMVCHGELAALKPAPRHLTAFYLAVAAGGALGGILVGIVAPVVFNRYWELELGLALSWALGLGVLWSYRRIWSDWVPRLVSVASVLVVAAILVMYYVPDPRGQSRQVDVSRNFYGALLVEEQFEKNPQYHRRIMVSGLTIHGIQYVSPARRREPTSYYGTESGVGLALRTYPRKERPGGGDGIVADRLRVGITGLGAGTLATYGQRGDVYRFYEINPDVIRLARDSGLFTYLSDSEASVEVVPGDARMSMERELRDGSQSFDVLVLDAFSGDAIPAHLLTREAFEIYLRQLKPGGMMAINVSNRVLDLKPVLWRLAGAMNLSALLVQARGDKITTSSSEWMLLTRDRSLLNRPEIARAGSARSGPMSAGIWTDDYHPLLALLK
jgi:hypothetical protein